MKDKWPLKTLTAKHTVLSGPLSVFAMRELFLFYFGSLCLLALLGWQGIVLKCTTAILFLTGGLEQQFVDYPFIFVCMEHQKILFTFGIFGGIS